MKKALFIFSFLLGSLFLVLAAFSYRNNRMIANDKINAIILADQKDSDTSKLRTDLEQYAKSHMNATSAVVLEKEYEREVAQAKAEAEAGSRFTIDVYKEATQACPIKLNSVSAAKCIQDYVNQHATTGQATVKPREVDKSKYSYAYTSPRWTWDESGWLFAAGVALVASSLIGLCVALSLHVIQRHNQARPMSASLPKLPSKK